MSFSNELRQELIWLKKHTNLGGSRYFAMMFPDIIQVNIETDWDFYAQDSDKMYKTLSARGYTCLFDNTKQDNSKKSEYEGDDNLSAIMIHPHHPNIQVLLRVDVNLYTKVIKSISPEFYRDYLWKSGPNWCARQDIQAIFNQLLRTANGN